MEHALAVWPEVAERLRKARRVLLLTDYDGTLTPIVERPELAIFSEEARHVFQRLCRKRHYTVAVISGRALVDLKEKIGVEGIIYAGNHGLEIEGPGIDFIDPIAEEMRPVLHVLNLLLRRSLDKVKGVIVEDKGLSLSVHYRQVGGEQAGEVKNVFERIVRGAHSMGKIRVTYGKKVYEVRPAVSWDKGKAAQYLAEKYGKSKKGSGLLLIYLGDDRTDEDAFKMIEKLGGISILVGGVEKVSAARYYLKSPDEVIAFFRLIADRAAKE